MLRNKIINIINNIKIVYRNKKVYPLYKKTTNLDPLERRIVELINLTLLDLSIIDEDNNINAPIDFHKDSHFSSEIKKKISKIIKKVEQEQEQI
jgi:hypothetical protein